VWGQEFSTVSNYLQVLILMVIVPLWLFIFSGLEILVHHLMVVVWTLLSLFGGILVVISRRNMAAPK
jgi:hypothetical protein